ncbi:portal protein, partial [Dyella japonica]|uniref:portal protein n=1 Tax=Dyella japonica TaxID=231455 RepID=UPI001B806D75
ADLDAAKPSHTAMMIKVKEWNDLMRIEGKAKPPKVKGRSQVQPKLVRRQAEGRYSALTEPFLGSNKLFKVTPVTWEDVQGARQNELVLNYQFRTKLNRVSFIDNYVRSV